MKHSTANMINAETPFKTQLLLLGVRYFEYFLHFGSEVAAHDIL